MRQLINYHFDFLQRTRLVIFAYLLLFVFAIMPRFLLPTVLFFLLTAGWARAQVADRFDRLSEKDQLPQSITYDLAQDSSGNLWLATEEGVVRFNSQRAYLYHTYRGLPKDYGSRIRTVHVDGDNGIWIGAEAGVARYDALLDSFLPVGSQENGPHLVRDLVTSPDGQLWIGAYNGLWKYKAGDAGAVQVANITNIECLYLDGAERLLVGSRTGLTLVDPRDNSLRSLLVPADGYSGIMSLLARGEDYLLGTRASGLLLFDRNTLHLRAAAQNPAVGQRPITAIQERPEGGIFVGSDGEGLFVLDDDYRVVRQYVNDINWEHALSSNGVYSLLVDRENMLWIATYGGGVNVLNPRRNIFHHFTHYPNSEEGLSHPFSRSLLEDEGGRIWFGTKRGISIWDQRSETWRHLLTEAGTGDGPIVMTMTQDDKYVYAGTYSQGMYKIDKATLRVSDRVAASDREGRIYASAVDENGGLWIGGINREVLCIGRDGTTTTYPISQVKTIVPARGGGTWAAGRNGLHRLNAEKATHISATDPDKLTTGYTTLNCLYERADGRLVIGTNGGGLLTYDPRTEDVRQYDGSTGLPSDIVQGILPGRGDTCWVSTTNGLVRLDLGDGQILQLLDRSDGLLSTEFNYGSFLKTSNGDLLFGGPEGVTRFDPDATEIAQLSPSVVIETFELFNERVIPGQDPLPGHPNEIDAIELAHNQNSFTFNFAGITHATPSKVRYRYRLDGLHDNWVNTGEVNQASFTNLDPGQYTFRLQAAVGSGSWSEERQLAVNIAHPWWSSWPAIMVYMLLLLALIAGLWRFVTLTITKKNSDRRIAFFNNIAHELKTPLAILLASLDNITDDDTGSSEDARSKVRSTVKRLNALFDQLLNFHKATASGRSLHATEKMDVSRHVAELTESFTPLLEEQSLTLTVEEDNLPARFYYNRDDFDRVFLNVFSNAVKYSRPGGNIRVHLAGREGQHLKVEVKDNGIGIPRDQQKFILREYYRARNAVNSQVSGTGLGLMMVKSLVERDGGQISFESAENEGTTFSLLLKSHPERRRTKVEESEELVATTQSESGEQSAKILVVEDNDELRENLCANLRPDYTVAAAANGREGLEMAGEFYPDIIITDLIMPEMDGMELAVALQEDISLNHIPVFMLTVLHNREQKVTSIERGVAEYLEKPVDLNLLRAKIAGTLEWRQRMRTRYSHQLEIQTADEHRSNREDQFITDLEQHVLQEIENEQFGVQDLCQFANMSRTSLYMKLKSLVDMSPQDFIIHIRLKLARQLLSEGEETIKEVAYRCGFSNPKYFSTSFKKKFGLSPRAFQKSLLAGT